ncbi:hypothetical protein OPV09_17590 [Janthinobacterium sp. TB1-E2]|uniref:Uncharacterized protein n=1 Tax=Janthinobacterium aestuarii TaxID=2985511 RepID=A0ABZ2GKH2_9BURK
MIAPWKKEAAQWFFASIIVIIFTFMIVALSAVIVDPKKGPASADAASWVQAIGTVVALFATYFFGERQAQHALRTATTIQDREHARKKSAFLAICLVARDNADCIGRVFSEKPYDPFRRFVEYQESATNDIVKALRAIPVHDVGSASATTALLNLTQDLSMLIIWIEAFDRDFESVRNNVQHAELRLQLTQDEIGRRVEEISQHYATLKVELGTTDQFNHH